MGGPAAGAIGQSAEAALSPDGYQLGGTACAHAGARAGSTGGVNGCTGHKLAGIKSQIVGMDTLALVRALRFVTKRRRFGNCRTWLG